MFWQLTSYWIIKKIIFIRYKSKNKNGFWITRCTRMSHNKNEIISIVERTQCYIFGSRRSSRAKSSDFDFFIVYRNRLRKSYFIFPKYSYTTEKSCYVNNRPIYGDCNFSMGFEKFAPLPFRFDRENRTKVYTKLLRFK